MNGNLYALLASRFPTDRSAPCFLVPGGAPISYGELEVGAGRIAALLRTRGVGIGDRVVVQAAKSPQMVMLYLAALKIGAVITPLNTAYTDAEMAYFLADAEPTVFVRDAAGLLHEAEALAPHEAVHEAAPDDLASIIYTSGTTGRSKGAMLSHRNLAHNGLALNGLWGFRRADVLLHPLPIFHVHGLFVALHCAFLSGAPMLWLDKFDEAAVLSALPSATVMMGVPTFYTRLLANSAFNRAAARHMRLFICGSAPLLPGTFDQFARRTGHVILERYGMSEAGIITSNPLDEERVASSVGYPLPGVSVRLGGDAVVEIKGESLFAGYWRMPEKTAEEFTADGWFKTGDIGTLDEDGRLRIVGRAKDLIISGGYNVYPKEIETVLDELDGVTESAVVAAPHPDFGEAVVAVVVGQGRAADLIAAARRQLAPFKTPKQIFFVEELPRNAMGKVDKKALRATYRDCFITQPAPA